MRVVDLLLKAKWDKRMKASEVVVEYEDRLAGNKRVGLQGIEDVSSSFLYVGDSKIPVHRIKRVFYKGIVIFDMEKARNIKSRLAGVLPMRGVPDRSFDWSLEVLGIDKVSLDEKRLKAVDKERVDFQRRWLKSGAFNPVIVVYYNFFLLDGYARYLAFKELGLEVIPAYLGLPKERIIWDWKKRKEVVI